MGIDAEMFVKTTQQPTAAQVRQWAYQLGQSFGHERFWIWEADSFSGERHCLEIVEEYTQDGDSLFPAKGETLIRVFPATRYYGEGYERGDLPFLIMLAEWLEHVIPGAEVWYGGDSSGVCAEKFDKAARMQLFTYFCEHGHEPYQRGFGMWRNDRQPTCPMCSVTMTNFGGGADKEFYECTGCGKKAITHGAEIQWLDKRADFFSATT